MWAWHQLTQTLTQVHIPNIHHITLHLNNLAVFSKNVVQKPLSVIIITSKLAQIFRHILYAQ